MRRPPSSLSLCLICPLHHPATLHSYCAQECGQDRYDKSDYLRPSILVFHSFFTFLHFYIFTFHRRFSFVFYHGFFFNPDYVFVFTTDFTDLTDFFSASFVYSISHLAKESVFIRAICGLLSPTPTLPACCTLPFPRPSRPRAAPSCGLCWWSSPKPLE